MPEHHKSQRAKILALLIAARGGEVPLPEIIAIAAQYNARIHELRRLGFRISSRTKIVNSERHSWLRLELQPAKSASTRNLSEPQDSNFQSTGTLFGDISPEVYPD